VPDAPDRDETPAERADRNWDELLQELRVSQTGVQILTGFLLTVPFQQRFEALDETQRTLYLVLVVLAVIATALLVAPVSLHRELFRRGLKDRLVRTGANLARAGLVVLALVLAGTSALIFDVVLSRTAGVVVGAAVAVMLIGAWWVLPHTQSSKNARART
jgi:hypothetical protein